MSRGDRRLQAHVALLGAAARSAARTGLDSEHGFIDRASEQHAGREFVSDTRGIARVTGVQVALAERLE